MRHVTIVKGLQVNSSRQENVISDIYYYKYVNKQPYNVMIFSFITYHDKIYV